MPRLTKSYNLLMDMPRLTKSYNLLMDMPLLMDLRACVRTAKFCKHATLSNLGKSNVVNA